MSEATFYIHNHIPVVVALLSTAGLQMVKCDVIQLNIVIGQAQQKSDCGYRMQLDLLQSGPVTPLPKQNL